MRGNPDGQLGRNLGPAFASTKAAIGDFSRDLRGMVMERLPADATAQAADEMLRQVLGAMDLFWTEADRELDRLLRQRIDGFYRRMALDLGTAALVWLISLGLILVVARQITGPIRELSRVARRIRHGKDYSLRVRVPCRRRGP